MHRQHNNYGSALSAQPGLSQARSATNSGPQPIGHTSFRAPECPSPVATETINTAALHPSTHRGTPHTGLQIPCDDSEKSMTEPFQFAKRGDTFSLLRHRALSPREVTHYAGKWRISSHLFFCKRIDRANGIISAAAKHGTCQQSNQPDCRR
jgi:hypothetical protein